LRLAEFSLTFFMVSMMVLVSSDNAKASCGNHLRKPQIKTLS
jgi:hypothetical protein